MKEAVNFWLWEVVGWCNETGTECDYVIGVMWKVFEDGGKF